MKSKRRFQQLRVVVLGIAGLAVLITVGMYRSQHKEVAVSTAPAQSQFPQPRSLQELVNLPPEKLPQVDIAVMNMLCAQDLPGAEDMKIEDYLRTLEQWAQHAKSETARNFHRFQKDPAYYYNSEAFYKMLMLAVVVYEDFGVRYNAKWISTPSETRADDNFFADAHDVFIHGMLGPQRMGTCSSMPILYIALGRRLGYPLKLVKARGHLFMRWDGPTERFAMDATGKGLDRRDDDYYRKWPFPITDAQIQEEDYLKSLSPREELSVFFAIRGACLADNGWLGPATQSYQAAYVLAPNWKGNQIMLAHAEQRQQGHAGLMLQRPDANMRFQQQAINPNIPIEPNPLRQMQNPNRIP